MSNESILILAGYAYPEHAASSYLSDNRNQAFADAGFRMELFTPTPCRDISKEMREKYCTREYKHESRMNGAMTIHRFSMYAEGNNSVLRALRYAFCGIALIWKGIFDKHARECSVMFVPSTPPIQGSIAAIVKMFTGKKSVYNLQDMFPDSLVNNGLARKGGLLWKIGRVMENFTYKHADRIIVISEDFKKNIIAKGVPEDKITVVYNWVDQDAVVDIPRERNKLFDKYSLDRSKFYVTYNGNIGLSQNMDMLLSVAEDFQKAAESSCDVEGSNKDPEGANKASEGASDVSVTCINYSDIQFVLVGSGAYLDEVKRQVKEKKLENVLLLPFQPYEDISHVFSLGDVSLVISKPGTGDASVPSKTWSIMSASRPVLANFDENELQDIINNNHCGIFTKAGDKEAFTNAIITLYKNRDLCKEYGDNGRQFILEHLTREIGTKRYVEVIKSVIAEYHRNR